MDIAMTLGSIAIGVSVVVSLIKLIDGWVHTDPRSLARAARWLLFLAALASVPGLALLLVYQEWALAMMLAAGMLAVASLLNWRSILPRAVFQPAWVDAPPADPVQGSLSPPPDAELVRRATIVLEDYLAHARGGDAGIGDPRRRVAPESRSPQPARMDVDEASEILGLEADAKAAAIRAAHRRLVQLVHPDRGGSTYLTAKVNLAKDTLLAAAARKTRQPARANSK